MKKKKKKLKSKCEKKKLQFLFFCVCVVETSFHIFAIKSISNHGVFGILSYLLCSMRSQVKNRGTDDIHHSQLPEAKWFVKPARFSLSIVVVKCTPCFIRSFLEISNLHSCLCLVFIFTSSDAYMNVV